MAAPPDSPPNRNAAPLPPSQRDLGATLGRLGRLMLKELREILRDRRTIITLVLMPLLVYPLLSIGFRQFYMSTMTTDETPVILLGFVSEEQRSWFGHYIALADTLPDDEARDSAAPENNPASTAIAAKPSPRPVLHGKPTADLQYSVQSYEVDLGIRLKGFDKLPDPRYGSLALECDLLVVEGYSVGEKALVYVRERLAKANAVFLDSKLLAMGTQQRAVPVRTQLVRLKDPERRPLVSIVTVLPLILILMTITGAVYPAIDLTAGERERGTLEILVAAPVPRIGLLLAKYVSVLTVAMLTATVNLLTMTVTIVLGGLGPELLGKSFWTPLVVLQIFGLQLLFAAFFSAVLLSLTSFARSFKEAQAYLIPLMVLSLAPGLLSLSPEMKLTGPLAVAPLINIVLLGRDLLEQNADPATAVVVVLTTCLYALAALALAARVFGSEDVLFNEQSTWSDLFRRPREPRAAPTMSSALTCLALMFPAYYAATNSLARIEGLSMAVRLVLSGAFTAILFGGFPLISAWLKHDSLTGSFNLRRYPWLAVPAALLLGLSLWPLAHEIVLWQQELGIAGFDISKLELVRKLMLTWRALPLTLVLLSVAILPGVFEELFFRGYLFSALRSRWGQWTTILSSALLFGAFHLVTSQALAIERFIPSTLLGIVLGWICWRSGSVLPGMLMHMCHNGFLVLVAYYQPWLSEQGIGLQEEAHLPAMWLLIAAGAAVCGGLLVYFSTRGKVAC